MSIPDGPWYWETTERDGMRLVADDGTVVLDVASGYGRPDLHSLRVQDLLREAWRVPGLVEALDEARQWAWSLKHRETRVELLLHGEPAWLTSDAPPAVAGEVGELDVLLTALEQAQAERDEARFYARGLATGMLLYAGTPYDPDQPPEWLYDRVDEDGNPMTWDGQRAVGPADPRRSP